MDLGLFAQFVMNGLMLGMMYALVAVGFTLSPSAPSQHWRLSPG
jgi:hypothetical protein